MRKPGVLVVLNGSYPVDGRIDSVDDSLSMGALLPKPFSADAYLDLFGNA